MLEAGVMLSLIPLHSNGTGINAAGTPRRACHVSTELWSYQTQQRALVVACQYHGNPDVSNEKRPPISQNANTQVQKHLKPLW